MGNIVHTGTAPVLSYTQFVNYIDKVDRTMIARHLRSTPSEILELYIGYLTTYRTMSLGKKRALEVDFFKKEMRSIITKRGSVQFEVPRVKDTYFPRRKGVFSLMITIPRDKCDHDKDDKDDHNCGATANLIGETLYEYLAKKGIESYLFRGNQKDEPVYDNQYTSRGHTPKTEFWRGLNSIADILQDTHTYLLDIHHFSNTQSSLFRGHQTVLLLPPMLTNVTRTYIKIIEAELTKVNINNTIQMADESNAVIMEYYERFPAVILLVSDKLTIRESNLIVTAMYITLMRLQKILK